MIPRKLQLHPNRLQGIGVYGYGGVLVADLQVVDNRGFGGVEQLDTQQIVPVDGGAAVQIIRTQSGKSMTLSFMAMSFFFR